MKKLTTGILALLLTSAPALLAQQTSPDQKKSSQNSQDVPQQSPDTNHPDLQPQRKPAPDKSQKQSPGSVNPSQNSPDVPHQQPNTNNPDVGSQRHPTPDSSSTGTQSNKSKKKTKRQKSASTASQSSTQK